MNSTKEIAVCPICGGSDIEALGWIDVNTGQVTDPEYAVFRCNDCDDEIPRADYIDEADLGLLPNRFKTGESLEYAIEHADRIDGMEELLDSMFFDLYELDPDKVCEAPYWICEGDPSYNWSGNSIRLSEDEYEPCITAPILHAKDLRGVDLWCQYVPGFHDPHRYGECMDIDGETYVYVGSESLPQEQEHQAEDGSLVYESRDYSFVRTLVKLDDIQHLLEYPSELKSDEVEE